MSHKEQLHHCLAWIDAYGCHEAVSTVSLSVHILPAIYLTGLNDLRKLFPGQSAKKMRDGSLWRYEIVVDGIRFCTWDWEKPEPSEKTSEVLL